MSSLAPSKDEGLAEEQLAVGAIVACVHGCCFPALRGLDEEIRSALQTWAVSQFPFSLAPTARGATAVPRARLLWPEVTEAALASLLQRVGVGEGDKVFSFLLLDLPVLRVITLSTWIT